MAEQPEAPVKKNGVGEFKHISAPLVSSVQEKDDGQGFKYNYIPDVESLERYRPGGYHPVCPGDTVGERYLILDKLGHGVATADARLREPTVLQALASPHPKTSALTLRGHRAIPPLLDEFSITGPNGQHSCYTTALAQGSIAEIGFSCLFPPDVARALSYSLVAAVAYMHSQGYVHGDVHLGNALVQNRSSDSQLTVEEYDEEYGKPVMTPITERSGKPLPPNVPGKAVESVWLGKHAPDFKIEDAHVALSDFGEAFNWSHESRQVQSCRTPLALRPPEARFDPESPLSPSVDTWGLAAALWLINGIKPLFASDFQTPDDMIADRIDLLGPMPEEWMKRWEESGKYFDAHGNATSGREAWEPLEDHFDTSMQSYRREDGLEEFSPAEKAAFLDLMRRMLAFRPGERLLAEDVLKSEWMGRWCLPDFERATTTRDV